jgi:hypothetical protein
MKERQYPGLVDPSCVRRITSFAEYDNRVTAPIHGFRNGPDYWTRSSSKNFLCGVRRPTLLISAQDDPFLLGAHIPTKVIAQSKWLTGEFPRFGGHVGFVQGRWPWSVTYWTESRTFAFLSSFM